MSCGHLPYSFWFLTLWDRQLFYAFCILCATPGKLPHCLCCQGTHIVVCTCHHVISVWIVPDKDMAQDIAPTHPQCRHSCTAESFSPKVWNQKTRKQIAKICKKKRCTTYSFIWHRMPSKKNHKLLDLSSEHVDFEIPRPIFLGGNSTSMGISVSDSWKLVETGF